MEAPFIYYVAALPGSDFAEEHISQALLPEIAEDLGGQQLPEVIITLNHHDV